MSQQVDLEELSASIEGCTDSNDVIVQAGIIRALRDELLSHRSLQEAKESGKRTAYEANRLDHWFNGKRMVYESTSAAIEQENTEMRDELVRLRKEMEVLRVQNQMWSDALTSKHAKLDEAKGLLETIADCEESGDDEGFYIATGKARAFLASLPTSKEKCDCSGYVGLPRVKGQPDINVSRPQGMHDSECSVFSQQEQRLDEAKAILSSPFLKKVLAYVADEFFPETLTLEKRISAFLDSTKQ